MSRTVKLSPFPLTDPVAQLHNCGQLNTWVFDTSLPE